MGRNTGRRLNGSRERRVESGLSRRGARAGSLHMFERRLRMSGRGGGQRSGAWSVRRGE